MRAFRFLPFLSVLSVSIAAASDLSLRDAVLAAERFGPELKVAAEREAEAVDAVAISRSYLYPNLELQGIESYGLPGSNGNLGLGGIMSSPFRSGPTGGLVSQWSFFDPTLYYGAQAARLDLETIRAQTAVVRYRVDEAVLDIYIDASRNRGARDLWHDLWKEMRAVSGTVAKLVRAGQHNPVDQFLVDDQVQEAAMNEAAFNARYGVAVKRLAFITGLDAGTLSCPPAYELEESELSVIAGGRVSPFVAEAEAQSRAAHARVKEKSAENYPKLFASAGAGGMESARLVKLEDYSAGIGVKLPLFEGLRIVKETSRAKNFAVERDFGLLSARLGVDETDAGFEETAADSRMRLAYLDEEIAAARRAFRLARERYLMYQGPLVDVREGLRDMARIESQKNDVKADLLAAAASRLFLSGGSVRP